MGVLVEDFGGKVSGELIKASDWNGVLAGIEALVEGVSDTLSERIGIVEARATELERRVDVLEADVVGLAPTVQAIRERYRRVNLSSNSTRFTIGQRGEIIARVTDIEGNPLDLDNAADRPWVDFVTVWGVLKPSAGFVSRAGAGDQTVSVQVNALGEARVRLRAEHAEAFAEEEEDEVEAVLSTQIAGNSVAEMFLAAQTPADTVLTQAYQAISASYDRTDVAAPIMQRYVDTYYVQNPTRTFGNFSSLFTQSWRDYRATVMAFVKPDAEPTSPDGAMAVGSIQVTFRDWIFPWIVVDYFPSGDVLLPGYRDRLDTRVGVDFADSLLGVTAEVEDIVRNKGLLGRQRDLDVLGRAVGEIGSGSDTRPFVQDLVGAVKGGLNIQRDLTYSQTVSVGSDNDIATMGAFANVSGKATTEADRVRQDLTQFVTDEVSTRSQTLISDVQAEQALFKADLLQEGGPITGVRQELQVFAGQIASFENELGKKASTELINSIIGASPG